MAKQIYYQVIAFEDGKEVARMAVYHGVPFKAIAYLFSCPYTFKEPNKGRLVFDFDVVADSLKAHLELNAT